ncbi:MAG: cell wall metabolism sensor histidine kinase WalK [bacterium]|nr:cell wall metabolism sensor histidine kinase WalK [bacterium]
MPPRVEGQLSDALIENLEDPAIGIDRNGLIRVVNESAAACFGKTAEEMLGQKLLDAIPLSDFSRLFLAQIKQTDPQPVEQVMVLPGNKLFVVKLFAVRTSRGRNLGAAAVLHDMAGVQKIERGFDQVLGDLTRQISIPITSVKGFVETLLEGAYKDPDITHRFLQIINDETNRLVRLVMKLEESLHSEPIGNAVKNRCRLEDIIHEAISMFGGVAASKNVFIEPDLPEDLPWVEADKNMLTKAIVNLVDNAVRFTGVKGEGKVSVSASQNGRKVEISVRDNGIGIAPDELGRIFERFYRSSKEPAASLGGTGLGLAVVKEIAEAHGGIVEATSELGEWSEFKIIIPIR